MNFKEKSKQHYVLFDLISFWVIDFEIIRNLNDDGKEIIHEFINIKEDFEFARKYVGGYSSDHTNEFGQRKVSRFYDFGPYPIDLLELEDYRKISTEEFEKQALEILSEYNSDEREIEFIEFIGKVRGAIEDIEENSHEFYQFLPADWKYNDLSPFQLSSYLCGFSINRIDKVLTVLQLDDD